MSRFGSLRCPRQGRSFDAGWRLDGADDDAEVFASVYGRLRRFASVVRSPDMDPDDLVQEALVRTLAKSRLIDLDDPVAYLRGTNGLFAMVERRHRYEFGTTREQLGKLAVTQRRNAALNPNALLRAPLSLEEYLNARLIADVQDLRHLDGKDRAAVYLAVVEMRPHSEIAEVLGCTEQASRARLTRALAHLRVELARETNHG